MIKNEMVRKLFDKLVELEGKEIDINVSGGFFVETTLTIESIKGIDITDEINSLSVIFIETDQNQNNTIQIWVSKIQEVIYDCPDTFATIAINFGNHYMHISV